MASVHADSHFFEGTEKLLEVWFSSEEGYLSGKERSLRAIERMEWDDLLKKVSCEIVSHTSTTQVDSYVLSESSMFVSDNRFILKTCGTTTLLYAVKPLLKLAEQKCGLNKVEDIFYSRKKFMRPELQKTCHKSFVTEVDFLDDIFAPDGAAYTLGRMNKECWYLYTLDKGHVNQPDQTLEILMTNLDQSKMSIFTKAVSSTAEQACETSGINSLLPNMVIDQFLFDPCGYSMNAILPDGCYLTIHITPEPEFSYVSFETNIPQASYHDLIVDLLNIFQPGGFLMTVIANQLSVAAAAHEEVKSYNCLEGYSRQDHQYCQFKNYELSYVHYLKTPS